MKNNLESHKDIVSKLKTNKKVLWWIHYSQKSEAEKHEIVSKWTVYYKKCSETPEAELFRQTKKALSENNTARVKDLAKQAREMLVNRFYELQKPFDYDPIILKNEPEIIQFIRSKNTLETATQKGITELF